MNDQPSPEVMAQAKAAGLRRGDSFSYSNDPKAAAAYHPGDTPVTRPDLDALIDKLGRASRAVYLIADAQVAEEVSIVLRKAAAALAAERARADQADSTLEAVRQYAEDRSIHHRAKKDSLVGSWRIASDLLAILDRDAAPTTEQ